MGNVYNKLREEEFSSLKKIKAEEYEAAREQLSEEEFSKRFTLTESPEYMEPVYREKIYDDIDPDEIDTYLLHENLKVQRKALQGINVIKSILIAFTVLSVCGAIIIAVVLG